MLARAVAPVVALVIVCAGAAAQAQTTGQAPTDPEAIDVNARRLFEAARQAYEERRFADALAYFQQVFALTPRPRLQYNIGLCQEHLGQRDAAIAAYEAYLAGEPTAPNRVEVESRLAVLRGASPAATSATTTTVETTATTTTPAAGPGPEGWIVFGASLGVAVAGGALIGVGGADYAAVTGLPDGGTYASVRDAQERAPVLLGVGIACAAVGLAGAAIGIVIATSSGGASSSTEVRARISPTGGSLEVRF
jgi:hypothetical protein